MPFGDTRHISEAKIGTGMFCRFAIVSAIFLSSFSAVHGQQAGTRFSGLDLFSDVFDYIRDQYVDPVNEQKLIRAALKGMLDSINPNETHRREIEQTFNSRLLEIENNRMGVYRLLHALGEAIDELQKKYPDKANNLTLATEASSGMLATLEGSAFATLRDLRLRQLDRAGVGLELAKEPNGITIRTVYEHSPAAKAMLVRGDIITHINNVEVSSLHLEEVIAKLTGAPGSKVILRILRSPSTRLELSMARELITKPQSVTGRAFGDVGYIRVRYIDRPLLADVTKIAGHLYNQITQQRLKGFILDLRGNTGGNLDHCVELADSFLERGTIAISLARKPKDNQYFRAKAGDVAMAAPLVVLVDNETASGAELIAAALQDNKRAMVVGTRTYGAGLIQTIMPIGTYGALRLTTSRLHTPAGRIIQGNGVTPDLPVERPANAPSASDPDIFVERALKFLREKK